MGQRFCINASARFFALSAVLLLLVPLDWLLGWVLAVLVHELSHCLVLRLCGKRIYSVSFDTGGAQIVTDDLSAWQTVLCTLAGPAGGLLVLLVGGMFPHAAVCALLLSVYNLLPVCPLDGGRAFQAILSLFLDEQQAAIVCLAVELIIIFSVLAVCAFATFEWRLGVLPLCLTAVFALRLRKIKIPCKLKRDRVQ